MTTCQECGKELPAKRRSSRRFCGAGCRAAFNNRRAARGAVLYDLFMTLHQDRARGAALGLWALMCRAEQQWRAEDERDRQGRASWGDAGEAVARMPGLRSVAGVARIGR